MDDVRGHVRNQAEATAFWEAIVRMLQRSKPEGNACLIGFGAAFDPLPRMRRTWLSEGEGLWADWTGLGCDLRSAMTQVDRSRSPE